MSATKLIKKAERGNYVTPLTKKEIRTMDLQKAAEDKAYVSKVLASQKYAETALARTKSTPRWLNYVSGANQRAIEDILASRTDGSGGVPVPLITPAAQARVNKENANPNSAAFERNNKVLSALQKFGYTGKLDGIIGRGAKKAMEEAQRLGYTWDANTSSYIKKLGSPINEELGILSVVNPELFGKDIYKTGTSPIRYFGNALTTFIPYAKTLMHNNSSADYHSTGTDEQIIAAAYGSGARPKDADARLRNGETITYGIGKDNKGYLWRRINGNKDVSAGGLFNNLNESGSHTLGLFTIEESPNGMRIIDNYDFNNKGESGTRVANGTASLYDYIRAAAPNKEDNPEYTGQSINWNIDRDTINGYITRYRDILKSGPTGTESGKGKSTLGGYQYTAPGGIDLTLGAFKQGGNLSHFYFR